MPEKIVSRKKKWSLGRILMVIAVIFLFGLAGVTNATSAEKAAKGSEVLEKCSQCHEDVVKAFSGKGHHALGAVCTDCHGKAEKHMEEGGALNTIVTFKGTAIQNNRQCLACHKTSAGQFMASPHGRASLDCTKCHQIHGKEAGEKFLKLKAGKLCNSCHEDISAQFMLNERHRLQEGILACTSCHNPHEPSASQRLGGFKQEACIKCHQDKGGPFVHEHEASRIEGCTVCHETHGSPNRHMLKHQAVSELCFSCHTTAPSWHAYFPASGANCVSCHTAIHGSNLDKLFLK